MIKSVKDNNSKENFILQIPVSPSQGKPPATKTGRIIQPNNLLKVLTANAQSLPPNIDKLIALIQVENFDVIALIETWLDTENKHLLAEVAMHGYKVFHVDKPTPTGRGGGSFMYVKNTLKPIESHQPLARWKLFKWTSIPEYSTRETCTDI